MTLAEADVVQANGSVLEGVACIVHPVGYSDSSGVRKEVGHHVGVVHGLALGQLQGATACKQVDTTVADG